MSTPKSECPVCTSNEGLYCPVHYVHDHIAEERALAAQYLMRDFADVRVLTMSNGLFVEHDGKRKPIDGNVFVEGLWTHVMAPLASYLVGLRRPQYRIVTDMALIEMKYTRDTETTFSSAVRAAPILILRLGFQLSSNTELPNVVFEALRQRELDGPKLRTVVINEPFVPWKKGHKAYSDDLNAYLDTSFTRVKIGAPKPTAKPPAPVPPSPTTSTSTSDAAGAANLLNTI